MPSAVPIFLKKSDEKQVIYFTWPNREFVLCLERGSWENRHSGSTTENCK